MPPTIARWASISIQKARKAYGLAQECQTRMESIALGGSVTNVLLKSVEISYLTVIVTSLRVVRRPSLALATSV
jgi:hypothetical protein